MKKVIVLLIAISITMFILFGIELNMLDYAGSVSQNLPNFMDLLKEFMNTFRNVYYSFAEFDTSSWLTSTLNILSAIGKLLIGPIILVIKFVWYVLLTFQAFMPISL